MWLRERQKKKTFKQGNEKKKLFLVFVFSFICVPKKKNALRSLPRKIVNFKTASCASRATRKKQHSVENAKRNVAKAAASTKNYAARNVDLNFFCSEIKKVICNNSFHARQASPLCQPPSSRSDSRIVLDVRRRSEIMIDTIEKSLFIAKRNEKNKKIKISENWEKLYAA